RTPTFLRTRWAVLRRHRDCNVIVTGTFAEIGTPVGRDEGTDGLPCRAGRDPSSLLGGHHTAWNRIGDEEWEDHLAQIVIDPNARAAFEVACCGVHRVHHQRWGVVSRAAGAEQR